MREKTRNKLLYLAETKSLIKSALIEKGQEVADGDDFRSYVDKIRAISGGATEKDIFPLQTVEGFSEQEGLVGVSMNAPVGFEIKEGETYYVEWDGTTYTCKGGFVMGYINYLGNGSVFGIGLEDSGEPFVIATYPREDNSTVLDIIAINDTSTSHKIRVYQKVSGGSADERVKYVTFMHGATELIKYPVIVGDTCKDVVAEKIIDEPTKEPTESTVYSFGGWSLTNGGTADENALTNVTEDRTVYVAFKESARMYTVNFYDGETLLKTEKVPYGGSVTYEATKDGYFLGGWSLTNGGEADANALKNITEDRIVYAVWVESIAFADATWADIDAISRRGDASKMWSVGDRKTITIGGVQRDIVIIGFDMDKDSNGNTVGVTMTLADEPYPIKKFAINKYDWIATSGTPQAEVENALANLPEDLQAVIKPVKKYYNRVNNYGDFYSNKEAYKSVWQFDVQELGMAESAGYTYDYTLPAYPYFNSNNSRVLKYNGTVERYSTRTIMKSTNGMYRYVLYVSTTGGFANTEYDASTIYTRFGFCV